MTPGRLRAEVIADRAAWVRDMVVGVRALPLESLDAFRADARNVASAESYLRRALEARVLEGVLAWVRANGDVVDGPTDVA